MKLKKKKELKKLTRKELVDYKTKALTKIDKMLNHINVLLAHKPKKKGEKKLKPLGKKLEIG